ncbi:unnamed protein product [Rangifer tarandus platyrhynchus]|uniref:Uncharacterized protein n=1 Tax=Rangifer tarandus platyrhynchus TaxID=3082113 RepID=A0AC59YBQ5_RANTA
MPTRRSEPRETCFSLRSLPSSLEGSCGLCQDLAALEQAVGSLNCGFVRPVPGGTVRAREALAPAPSSDGKAMSRAPPQPQDSEQCWGAAGAPTCLSASR